MLSVIPKYPKNCDAAVNPAASPGATVVGFPKLLFTIEVTSVAVA
jgi:hypothetical protein